MPDEQATLSLALESDRFESGLKRSKRHADELSVSTGRLSEQANVLSSSLKNASGALFSLYAGSKVIGSFGPTANSSSRSKPIRRRSRSI